MNWGWITANTDRIGGLALAHANLSWPAIVASLVIALPLGWVASRNRISRELLVTASGLLYAIPSLALFVVLPLVIGTSVLSPLNVIVAMTLYGLALQIRTTADAFDSVPEPQKQAAVAMGYPAWRQIITVELPLAGPIILAGLRVVSASTISLVSVGALTGVQSLGTLFTNGFARSFPTEIMAGVGGTVILALIFDAVLVLAGRILMPWAKR
ncbi:ABC transporter permease [Corynebacterium pygosceleis]|uniref:ABC transporter permease subunit n=1 Tax=Corynebacterium pygosceleis TaxID=2800406 RepID=A0A9Q4C8N9_9CORY|nr:ABC transporter permease subunit [Corynebacterium pygosceleis]MCK7638294.1 ABC transporter permease subunit [Corynebacterium pygosceleis]MCL0121332.1 ABC transporter permease subunit [Corynebacterium pygosceleis]MCX7445654.1 ABC transporter permease subunit [Corynebacterium pygosceleis]MCX7468956.1 ABC transporter permease subunit [Corynebacterium pygosceleis]